MEYKALTKFNIKELYERQKFLDSKFESKETLKSQNLERTLVALGNEIGETAQEFKGEWNYWKNNCTFDKEKILSEFSDCLHFILSLAGFLKLELDFELDNEFNENKKIFEDYSFEKLILHLYFPIGLYLYEEEFEDYNVEYFIALLLEIIKRLGFTEEEFLEQHHKVFINNLKKRIGDDY